jgi:hypothetical protein
MPFYIIRNTKEGDMVESVKIGKLVGLLTVLMLTASAGCTSRQPVPSGNATAPPTPALAVLAEAEEVARGFIEAYGAFDADRAMAYLTDGAIAEMSGSLKEFRLDISLREAQGIKQTINGCEQWGDPASGISVRCAFDMHALRSDEIGLGPYTDNYWDLTVRDGKIVSATESWAYLTNGFSKEMWEPFADWVSAEHPKDVAVMYTDGDQTSSRRSRESFRLWEKRTREYAEEVGR